MFGEMVALMAVVGAVVALGRAVAKQLEKVGQNTDDAWGQASRRLGLSHDPGSLTRSRLIEGRYKGHAVVVDTVRRGSGASSKTYTRYRVGFPRSLRMGLRVSRSGIGSSIGRMLGLPDVRTGDRTFDRDVAVKGDDRRGVMRLLTPRRRDYITMMMQQMPELTIDDDGIEYLETGVQKKPGRITFTTQQIVSLAQQLTEAETSSPAATGQAQAVEKAVAVEESPAVEKSPAVAQAPAAAHTRSEQSAPASQSTPVGKVPAAAQSAPAASAAQVREMPPTSHGAPPASEAPAVETGDPSEGTGMSEHATERTREAPGGATATSARTDPEPDARTAAPSPAEDVPADSSATAQGDTPPPPEAVRTRGTTRARVVASPPSEAQPDTDEPFTARPEWFASSADTELPDLSWTESGPAAAPDLEWARPTERSSPPDMSWAKPTTFEAPELEWAAPSSGQTEPDLSWALPPDLPHYSRLPFIFAGGKRLPREWDRDPEASEPTDGADELSTAVVCETLYGSVEATLHAGEVFEARYEGRTVTWDGVLRRVIESAYDFAFGIGHDGRGVFQIRAGEPTLLGSGPVRAVVQLPPATVARLASRTGERVAFEGRLVSIDVFGRMIYVAEGRVPDVAPAEAAAADADAGAAS